MPEPGRIQPRLRVFDTAMVVVSLVIGIGIFRAPALVARAAGSESAFLGVWALGGLVSLIGALTYAEIGARMPRAGGYYRVVAECYHPLLAFMLNWSQALLQGAGAAGVAFIGAEYLNLMLLPAEQRGPQATLIGACALMVALVVLNLLGVRAGARTQNVLSMAKLVLLAGLALAGLLAGRGALPAATPSSATISGFLSAAVAVFYAYGGYQCTMNLGGDVCDARRNLPRALCLGMGLVTGVYLLINLAYLKVLGLAGLSEAPLVAAELARQVLGPHGADFVSAAIFLSAAGFVNATIVHVPRSYYAMAEDGTLPALFLRVNPRTQAQEPALLFFVLTMLGPALMLGSFEKLLHYVMFSDALALALLASALFVLRRRRVGDEPAGGFRMPGYPVLPALFVLCLLALAGEVLRSETRLALAGLGVMLVGIPLFWMMRRVCGRPGPFTPARCP